jgi:hypothetical protein
MARPKTKSLSLTTEVKEDKIYVLTAINCHGQACTISTASEMKEALDQQASFLILKEGQRYWMNKGGKIETFIEAKQVPAKQLII